METRASWRGSRSTQGLGHPVEYVDGADVNDPGKLVTQLPRKTIVYLITYTHDLKGNIYYTPDVVALLSLPIDGSYLYAEADTIDGNGAVGGYVVNFERSGSGHRGYRAADFER